MDYSLKEEHQENLPLEGEKENEKRWQRFYLGIGAAAVLFFLLFIFCFSYNAVKNLGDDSLTLGVARMVGLPAGFVDSSRISYVDFQEDLMAVRHFYDFQAAKNPGFPAPSAEEMRKSVWDRLAKNLILKKTAREAELTINQKDLDQEFEKVIKDLGSKEAAEQMVSETYGWTGAQFKNKILLPFLLQEKLASATSTLNLPPNKTLDDYLNEQTEKAKIWKWVRI